MWSRVRGGTGRFPPGHRSQQGSEDTEEDWYALFDLKNYQHRPRDRGFLLGPQIPQGQSRLCLGFWVYMATDVSSVPYLGMLRFVVSLTTCCLTAHFPGLSSSPGT